MKAAEVQAESGFSQPGRPHRRWLKACPSITRQWIGIDHRLLFRLLPDRVQVVDSIPRQDLARRIRTLV